MEAAGATLVEIGESTRDIENYGQKSYDLLLYEFKDGLNDYLKNAATAVGPRSLEALIEFNANEPREMAVFHQDIFDSAQAKGSLTDETYIAAKADLMRGTRAGGIDKMMADNSVDMLVSPSGPVASRIDPVNGDVWPSWAYSRARGKV